MMSLIWTIIIGFIIGLVARALHPGDDKAGFIVTTLLGVGGSLAATYAGQLLNLYKSGEPAGFIMSVVGAVLLLVIYNFVRRRMS